MSERGLACGKILVAIGILGKLLISEGGDVFAVDRDQFVLLVEAVYIVSIFMPKEANASSHLHPLRLPIRAYLLAEEDEPAVALNIDLDALDYDSLCNGGLHLANSTVLCQVDIS